MKINAKLLVVAFILAIFSIGAVAAGENMTGSSDFTQVPHEHVVSVSEPTVPEVETTDLQTSADDTTYSSSSGSDEKINVTDSSKGSLKKGNENSLLGVANDEDVLGSRIIYPSGTTFLDIKNAINSADTNDTVDLNGSIYKGSYTLNLNANKQITIQNGVIDGSNVVNGKVISFTGVTLKNVHFTNFHYNTPGNYPRIFSFADCILENVKFSNSSNDVYTGMFSALQRVRAVNVSYDGIVSGTCVGSIKKF